MDNIVAFITKSVQEELREIYPGIFPEEEISLSESLSRIKHIVGQKFIIIIDEWDVLIRDEAANKKVQERYALMYMEHAAANMMLIKPSVFPYLQAF